MGRKFFVGGNWKCNGTTEEVKKIVSTLNGGEVPSQVVVEVVVSPPFVFLPSVKSSLRPDFHVAAQNCWVKKGGAFTGEVIDDNKNAKPDSKEIGDAMMEERDSDNGKDKMLVTQNGDNGIAEDDDEIDPLDAFMNSMVLPEVEKLNNAVGDHPTTAGDDKNENLKKDKKDGFSNGGQQRRKDSNKALGRIISGYQQNESFTCSSRDTKFCRYAWFNPPSIK